MPQRTPPRRRGTFRNLDAPRQQYLANHLRAAFRAAFRATFRTAFRTAFRATFRTAFRATFRTAAFVPLAPLRTKQRIVIRSGTLARAQCRRYPFHRRARLRRRHRFVQRQVNLFGPPAGKRPALGRNPEPATLQQMNRQPRAAPVRPAR